jgi:DNA-binding response OmpR family regulator
MARKRRILIVDDDSKSVDILCRLLRDRYVLKTASTGDECLVELTDFRPHLVLLDIMMPGISGHEACRRIKFSPLSDSVRIILVSAKETIVDSARGSDVLADDSIIKPFDHEELLAKVRAQLEALDSESDSEPTSDSELAGSDSIMSQQQRERFEVAMRRLEGNARHQLHPIT